MSRWMLLAATVAFVGLLVVLRVSASGSPGDGTISGAEARKLVAAGALLLDVRSRGEYESGHVDGAKNIPVNELQRRLPELGSKDKPIVVYCESGARSMGAVKMLRAAGFTQVHDMVSHRRW